MFSIIIPVHNTEKYLPRLIESILAQSYSNFEVLLIENGSSDKSYDVCCEYAAKDERVRAFDIGKCNGPSRARNYGLDVMRGDRVVFVDSDDYIEADFLEDTHKALKENELVFIGYIKENESGLQISKNIPDTLTGDIARQVMQLEEKDCFGYTWSKVFKKEAIKDIRFDESLNLFEDEIFTLKVLKNASSITTLSKAYYHYVVSAGVLTLKTHKDIIQKRDVLFQEWIRFLDTARKDILIKKANVYVNFCRYYIYEHGFDLKKSYQELIKTEFFEVAKTNPSDITKKIAKGYISMAIDYWIWKTRTILGKIK